MTMMQLSQGERLDMTVDKENRRLHVDWRGRYHDASIKEGINLMIGLMTEHQVFKVLNDNTHAAGMWLSMAGWLVWDALPRARAAGLHSFAHVFGSNSFPRVSAEAALRLLGPGAADIKTFENIDDAKAWLHGRN